MTSVNISSSETVWYLTRFSKYSRILRLVAWILRFAYNSRYHNSKRGELTVNEIQIAEKKLLKPVQQESFDDTVIQNKLKSLNVFTDNEGLMRLKTKIVRRKDDENFKCPIVLPSNHLLVERLIFENHTNSCHSGTQVVLSNLRQQFWVLRGRKTVQRVINQCIRFVNSRPLNYLSDDPDDLTPLTPSMFLQDIQTVGIPDQDNIDNINLTRYQQRLRNDLRNRFRDEYLSLLVHQESNKAGSKEVRVGDVVLIGCDNKKRLDCPMGLVFSEL
ncbi:DUF5641 domain-containing protein [Trichonephila inaurata madagascariensis]|uniref:DUF5641 domain-containing protein n=1 Tax=Trichonephila inaurata madagascariensis TaxID=2747483 RepID=A0A8X7CHH4_9ARAC|nr:DUF5641 domain-containing protein [Trichonephila inaurata madagascariensis]